ncbi:MAG: LysM peptidoglycan-binding domain-containing protein [Anaerolineae bacterium]|nr:MAG: LysM peptidoglycan-binding domain-containing protein [Anaerolineae bacterium]
MKARGEILAAALAALISLTILGGSLAAGLAEQGAAVALRIPPSNTPTATTPPPLPTVPPGQPTYTPSSTPSRTPSPTTAAQPTACPVPENWQPYTVQNGDTLPSLAARHNVSQEQIISANCLLSETLLPGSSLYLPPLPTATATAALLPTVTPIPCGPPAGWITYIVQAGDTLYRIGLAYGVTVGQLQQANCLGASTYIQAGQTLYVPNVPTRTPLLTATATPTETATPTVTASPSATASPGVTLSPTSTSTATATATSTATATASPTAAATSTSTNTPTASATSSPTATDTPTASPTATATATTAPTSTSTATATATIAPTATPTASPIP